jgi:hypothetical protein
MGLVLLYQWSFSLSIHVLPGRVEDGYHAYDGFLHAYYCDTDFIRRDVQAGPYAYRAIQ